MSHRRIFNPYALLSCPAGRPLLDFTPNWVERLALFLCAVGYIAHILLAEPTLNMLGFPYGAEDANLLAKIHPGNFLIFAGFGLFLFGRGNPLERFFDMARRQTPFVVLLLLYTVILVYWAFRSPPGVGMVLDVHMTMPICVILFSYAAPRWNRRLVTLFLILAVVNGAIGIAESMTHARLFPFDDSWEVLHQNYFRASALMGHPLVNAAFTGVALFVLLGTPMPTPLKALSFAVMLAALVAFGGRSSFVFTLAGLAVWGVYAMGRLFLRGPLTVMRLSLALLILLTVPLLCGGLLYAALDSGMGERLVAYSTLQDESTSVRVNSWRALSLISTSDLLLGIGNDRVEEIGGILGITNPTSDIENPWVLILMFFGLLLFVPWLIALLACIRRLICGASLPLALAVICYFLICSTSNSFGRKDPIFTLIPAIVMSARQSSDLRKSNQAKT